LYTVTGTTPWALTLPAASSVPGTGTWLKNMSSVGGTVGTNVYTLGSTTLASSVTMLAGDGGYFESNGANWWVLSANRVFTAQ